MSNWDKYEKAAEKGPMNFFWKALGPFLLIILVLSVAVYIFGWFGEAAQVAKEEFGPSAALEKYEWFIDQANFIEKMNKDIEIFQNRITKVNKEFSAYGENKSKWPPHIQIQYNDRISNVRDDLAAIMSQRNNLVKDYNAESNKFNWKPFKTKPDLPKEHYEEYQTDL